MEKPRIDSLAGDITSVEDSRAVRPVSIAVRNPGATDGHLEQAYNGRPQMLTAAIGSMYGLKAKAQALMLMPTEDGLGTAGPTFEYVASRLPPSRG